MLSAELATSCRRAAPAYVRFPPTPSWSLSASSTLPLSLVIYRQLLLLLLVQTIIHAQLQHRLRHCLRHCLCPISDCTNKVLRCEAAAAMRSASPPLSISFSLFLLHCSLIDDNILEFLLVFLRSSLSCRLISHSHSLQQQRVKQGVGRGRGGRPLASQGQHSCVESWKSVK